MPDGSEGVERPECEHVFRSDGVVYKVGGRISGSSAKGREYFDAYICEKCLERRLESIGWHGSTYGEVLFGARPVGKDE